MPPIGVLMSPGVTLFFSCEGGVLVHHTLVLNTLEHHPQLFNRTTLLYSTTLHPPSHTTLPHHPSLSPPSSLSHHPPLSVPYHLSHPSHTTLYLSHTTSLIPLTPLCHLTQPSLVHLGLLPCPSFLRSQEGSPALTSGGAGHVREWIVERPGAL